MSKIKRLDKIKMLLKEARRQIRKYGWLETDLWKYDDDPYRICSDRFDRVLFHDVIDHLLKQLEIEKKKHLDVKGE